MSDCYFMDIISLSRVQFAVTTIYHFLFVPLTIGLSLFVAYFETMSYRKKDASYQKLAQFFGKLFLINFTMGVVTGIVQEFQFGMNWAGYSRFVGDIFGAPLAIEALAAFFLESTFLGLWIFGRDKLPAKVHLACIWIVAIASSLSAYWILVANSFMQEPTGYILRNGRAEMTDFIALITNPHLAVQYPHTIFAGITTAAFFVLGISAYMILSGKNTKIFLKGLKTATVIGLVAVLIVAFFGDLQGKYLVQHQPMKMAAAEALWETQEPAALSIFSIIDESNRKNTFEIALPNMLSFLSYGNFTGKVIGINELQKQFEKELGKGNYIPPVTVLFWSFRIMVGLAGVLIFAALLSLYFLRKDKILNQKWLLKTLLLLIPVPYLCNSFGWIVTEMGRQPWLVYKVLKLENAVSKAVNPGYVLTSLIGFSIIYGSLAAVAIYLVVKTIKSFDKEVSE